MASTIGIGKSLLERLKNSRENDDWVDRFVYWVSPCVIIPLAVIIGAKQYVGKPIQCWAPNEFKSQWMRYAEGYCFVEISANGNFFYGHHLIVIRFLEE
ncbi:hypothetical protein niasHT_017197 [Heterodera trifolii]|uniref:Innexin n=1 Tax=Heterodera trifolii TaxID=157864 RepID=A0ABD2LD64_9BILA